MTTYYPSSSSSSYTEASPTSNGTNPAAEQSNPHQTAVPGDVPAAVHSLLASTKRLQEILKLWSVDQATEDEVSDLYVKVGHEFNTTISAFAYHQIDLSDIHSFPVELRTVLENCLAEEPSPEVLVSFMPDLRKVLYNLLKGLQSRQDMWRTATHSRGSSGSSLDSR